MNTISRRAFLSAAAGLAAAGSLPLGAAESGKRPPNVILIMADDLSARELGCYGHPEHRTPNLDGLAATGVRFTTCWATPICSPSRAEIMSGRYGFRTGWFHNELKTRGPLCANNLTLGQVMKSAGYATAIAGKWQLPGLEKEHGFDTACMWLSGHPLAKTLQTQFDGPVEDARGLAGRTARYWHPAIVRDGILIRTTDSDYGPDIYAGFINEFAAKHKDKPFFAYYPMCLTHGTWDFDHNRSGFPAPPELDAQGQTTGRKGEPTFRASVEYMDHLVGRIVANLERHGLRENTVVIFTGDNGTSSYGKSRVEGEKGPRVPMIVNCPGLVKPLGACDELVDFSDVLPTLAHLAGAKLPDGYVLDGRSFAPLLRGETFKGREWIFSCFATHRMLRDKRWLLDGHGRLYDCGVRRDESGYRDVTDSQDAEAVAARQRFEKLLENLPGLPDDMRRQWEQRPARSAKRGKKE